jgi:hypothetical protein
VAGTQQERIARGRRQARWVGALGFVLAALLPVVLFGRVVALLAEQPRLDVQYLSGWIPWVLLAGGLLFLAPVAWSAGMDPESRFFPRGRTAYAGWGVTLYLLGLLLAWQVWAVQDGAFS